MTAADLSGGRSPNGRSPGGSRSPVIVVALGAPEGNGGWSPATPPKAARVNFELPPSTPVGTPTAKATAAPDLSHAFVQRRVRRSWTTNLSGMIDPSTPAARQTEASVGPATPMAREECNSGQTPTPTWGVASQQRRPRAWTENLESHPRAWIESPNRQHQSAQGAVAQFGYQAEARSAIAGDLCSRTTQINVVVVAPGAGTGCNKAAYSALERRAGFKLHYSGRSGAADDKYPPGWPTGQNGPNLYTFAQGELAKGTLDQADCLVFGSRGGQVVLPAFWEARGNAVPPAVVMNGGVARDDHPTGVRWPEGAVTFLIIGGKDYFRGHKSIEDYLTETLRHVPAGNTTTAVLLVDDMGHMPHTDMLDGILKLAIRAVVTWKASQKAPVDDFKDIANVLAKTGWTGKLLYKQVKEHWDAVVFRNGA